MITVSLLLQIRACVTDYQQLYIYYVLRAISYYAKIASTLAVRTEN